MSKKTELFNLGEEEKIKFLNKMTVPEVKIDIPFDQSEAVIKENDEW